MKMAPWPSLVLAALSAALVRAISEVPRDRPSGAVGLLNHHSSGNGRAERLRRLYAADGEPAKAKVLRVCNAYAFGSAVDVFWGEPPHFTQKITTRTGPLPFKQCFDLPDARLEPGDKLEFIVGGDLHLGTFVVTNLPEGSLLQLVISRHDEVTTAATFSSHVFQDMDEPQVAVVDAYIGPSRSKLQIRSLDDPEGSVGRAHEESVKYGRVVTVHPGDYRWSLLGSLVGQESKKVAEVDIHCHPKDRFTAIRLGIKAHHGPSFNEDLVVFPGGEAVQTHSGAGPRHGPALAALLAALALGRLAGPRGEV